MIECIYMLPICDQVFEVFKYVCACKHHHISYISSDFKKPGQDCVQVCPRPKLHSSYSIKKNNMMINTQKLNGNADCIVTFVFHY